MQINKPVSIVILFAITLVVAFVLTLPAYQQSLDLQREVAQKQAEYAGKSAYFTSIVDLTQKIEGNSLALEKISSALPDDFSLASLVYFLQKEISEAGLVTKLIVFSKTTPGVSDKKFRTINFTVNASGSYQGLKTFLASIEKSSRLFEVNAIYFKSPAQSPARPNQLQNRQQIYDFNLELQTHAYEK